ncbi:MAG: GNAT family N-acetyltransferase [Alphaproteobacteria bacterium]|nr:GNAT family N-acetyltransferase [Alphaproteobacteria bacterium]
MYPSSETAAMTAPIGALLEAPVAPAISANIVRDAEELMQTFAVRSAVYMAEQDCPYEEEFDGNDYTSTHILGRVDGKPAGCLRLRWFAGFAKAERMTVMRSYRGSGVAVRILDEGFELCRRKGYSKVHVHAQRRLVPHWQKAGFQPVNNQIFHFSDHEYVSMVIELATCKQVLDQDSDPMLLLRPEGDFDRPGILERSAERLPTNPTG